MLRSTDNRTHGFFPWLRKKESSWSLRSFAKMNRHNSVSTVSLPMSIISSTLSSNSTIEEPEKEEEIQPPSYDDKSHPWTFQLPKSLSNRIVLPREEEGKELLPDYECTVQKTFYSKVKCELSTPTLRANSRSWRYYYIQLFGTKIMAFTNNPNKKKSKNIQPVWTHSMYGAEVTVASDYLKERHVLRLRIENGPQYLITMPTEKDRNDWIACIESAINISSDLDVRSMPQFITLISRRRRLDLNGTRQLPAADQRDTPLL
ncbi:hypothetical protein BDF21DRAFT_429252 [Thamnidium elegans]|uniref:PH domain-containing protein n=1 Tax=Thamnidium elegans TaxID=101142 RepID=A0A8H7VUS1_9FUNG|nr:hypothetical protein INT48_007912 [Thamnidium elegans]KAI8061294.1 hypothetical protein BDF21DRAFT_429252 [Thamnidium elegans]